MPPIAPRKLLEGDGSSSCQQRSSGSCQPNCISAAFCNINPPPSPPIYDADSPDFSAACRSGVWRNEAPRGL